MFQTAKTTVKPSGVLVHEAISAGNTVRFRNDLAVRVYETGDVDSPLRCFEVFVADRFVAGWRTLAQAVQCAERW
jgi:hypothetical protein